MYCYWAKPWRIFCRTLNSILSWQAINKQASKQRASKSGNQASRGVFCLLACLSASLHVSEKRLRPQPSAPAHFSLSAFHQFAKPSTLEVCIASCCVLVSFCIVGRGYVDICRSFLRSRDSFACLYIFSVFVTTLPYGVSTRHTPV